MKRVLQLVLVSSGIVVLNLVTVVILLGLVGGIGLGAAGPPNDGCGDVNGDGTVQISDAVYLLNFLFQNGPELVCAQPPEPPSWPPRPEDIITLTGIEGFQDNPIDYLVYEVPDDHWFVLTDIRIDSNGTFSLVENDGGVETLKFLNQFTGELAEFPYESSTGISFAPGSDVRLTSNTGPGIQLDFFFSGYLVDAAP